MASFASVGGIHKAGFLLPAPWGQVQTATTYRSSELTFSQALPIGRRTELGRPRSPLPFMPLWVAVLVSCYRRHDGKQPRVPEWIFKLVSVITRITTVWIVQTTDEES
jgi:hypothetical protein